MKIPQKWRSSRTRLSQIWSSKSGRIWKRYLREKVCAYNVTHIEKIEKGKAWHVVRILMRLREQIIIRLFRSYEISY